MGFIAAVGIQATYIPRTNTACARAGLNDTTDPNLLFFERAAAIKQGVPQSAKDVCTDFVMEFYLGVAVMCVYHTQGISISSRLD
jgi:hypothetical protein